MNNSKYVVFEDSSTGHQFAVVFPHTLSHWQVGRTFERGYVTGDQRNWSHEPAQPIAAGFVEVSDKGEVYTFGNSETLHLSSRKEDSEIVAKAIKGGY